MNLFEPFVPSAWHDRKMPFNDHELVTPDGQTILAINQFVRKEEIRTYGEQEHIFPMWFLTCAGERVGTVYRRTEFPLDDIRHALDLGPRRAALKVRLEVAALMEGCPSGIWRFRASDNVWVRSADQAEFRPAAEAPPLIEIFEAAWVGMVLFPGTQGIAIQVPPSRHGVMERLNVLMPLLGG